MVHKRILVKLRHIFCDHRIQFCHANYRNNGIIHIIPLPQANYMTKKANFQLEDKKV